MACFSPVEAWLQACGKVVFAERGDIVRPLLLPCGQCVGCRLERSRQWAVRIMHEASLHDCSCFITLTYDSSNVPFRSSLVYSDFQLFLKRLRRRVGCVRFFMCGEYGDLNGRPHFHVCLFGFDFSADRVAISESLFRSPLLESLWTFGFSSVGSLTFESAAYVARYVMKKVTGPSSSAHYERVELSTGEFFELVPEFCHMSLKPGIGAGWISQYLPEVLAHGCVIVNGSKCNVPRYYLKYLKGVDPSAFDILEFERYQRSLLLPDSDFTPARLAVREAVCAAGVSLKSRSL